MNLFKGRGRAGNDASLFSRLLSTVLEQEVKRATARGLKPSDCLIGIRPEHVTTSAAGDDTVAAKVTFVEPLGQTTNVFAEAEGCRIVMAVGRSDAKIDDVIHFRLPPESLRLVEADPED